MKKLTKKAENGLVVGKFYPPHKGHKFLIDTASANSRKLTVIVVARDDETIPGDVRAQWISEMHPKVKVITVPDIMDDDNSKAWAAYTMKILGGAPDAVFTSEDYGDGYAKYMGARHFLVDKKRINVPVSARYIREDPFKYWEFLGPPVRAYYAKRIVVLGAESTGTTTMAKALADRYRTSWVPEYGRFYSEGKLKSESGKSWETGEFIHIAEMQNKIEDEVARTANKLLICDTDSFATSLWQERYMGFISQEVDKLGEGRNYDLYLLTDADIPFVQDGTRDGEHIRAGMHERFIRELEKRGKKYLLLSGTHEARLAKAIEACDELLTK